jgi:hypothetical protein
MAGLEVEDTTLVWKGGDTKARAWAHPGLAGHGNFLHRRQVDDTWPADQRNEFVKNLSRGSRGESSYEAFDPVANQPIEAYSWPGGRERPAAACGHSA